MSTMNKGPGDLWHESEHGESGTPDGRSCEVCCSTEDLAPNRRVGHEKDYLCAGCESLVAADEAMDAAERACEATRFSPQVAIRAAYDALQSDVRRRGNAS